MAVKAVVTTTEDQDLLLTAIVVDYLAAAKKARELQLEYKKMYTSLNNVNSQVAHKSTACKPFVGVGIKLLNINGTFVLLNGAGSSSGVAIQVIEPENVVGAAKEEDPE